MFKNYGLLFSVISSVFISLYLLMYILRNIYYSFENKTLRIFINKLLPILSKYNPLFLILGFIATLLHIFFYMSAGASILNTGYVPLFILIIIIKFTFFSSKDYDNTSKLNILSYLLLFSLIIHCFI